MLLFSMVLIAKQTKQTKQTNHNKPMASKDFNNTNSYIIRDNH